METLAFTVASVFLEIAFVGRLLYLACARCKDFRAGLRSLASYPRRAISTLTSTKKHTAQEKLIESEVFKLRVVWAKRFILLFCVLSLQNVTSMQQSVFLGRDRWMSFEVTWTNIFMFAVGTVLVCFPSLVRPSTLSFLYGIYMLVALMYITPWFTAAEQAYTFSYIVLLFFRLPCVVFCSRFSLALFFNLGFAAVMYYRASTEDLGDSVNPTTVIWTEAVQTAAVLTGLSVFQRILSQRVEMNIQRNNAQTQLSAAQALLRLMCDAVVELDEDLRLTSDSPELSALLLNRDLCGYTGTKLTDLMPEVEAQRASDLLGSFSGSPGFAEAFHTRMVDSTSHKLCVELLQVKYKQMDGQSCHLIGIRDFADSPGGDGGEECTYSRGMDEEDDIPSTASGPEEAGPERKNAYLDIDMIEMRVNAASAPVDNAVGMGLLDLFPAPHTLTLLQRLQHEAIAVQDEPLRGNSFLYEDLPICFGAGKGCLISGSMQVIKTGAGPSNVLLCFGTPSFPKLGVDRPRSRRTSASEEPPPDPCRTKPMSL